MLSIPVLPTDENLTKSAEHLTFFSSYTSANLAQKKRHATVCVIVDLKILENQTIVELKVTGELLGPDTALFKSHLVKLLQYGKSKICKIDPSSVVAIDKPEY